MESATDPRATWIKDLHVAYVRCFGPPQVLSFTDDTGRPARWTVLLGENGTGKTTLLQLISSFLTRRDVDGQSFARTTPHGIRIDLTGIAPTGTVSFGHFNKKNLLLFPEQLPHTFAYGATRAMSASALASDDLPEADATLFAPDARLVNAEEWLLRLDYLARSQEAPEAARRALERVKELLIALLPDVTDIHILGPRVPAPGRSAQVGGVAFDTPYGRVPLKGLSLGYQTLTAWTVDLAYRLYALDPEHEAPLSQPCVVLVDEIDLHLHPSWQRQIQHRLLDWFPNAQFIVTAHSPLVVLSAADANLAVLRRVGDHVEIENDPQVVRGWRVDQVLTSDLFGLESARSPEVQALLDERTHLLSQRTLSAPDEARITALEAEVGELPYGETREDRRAEALIREAARLLGSEAAR